jgi:hypothetical protein
MARARGEAGAAGAPRFVRAFYQAAATIDGDARAALERNVRRAGRPAGEVLAAASERGVNLIALTSHGRRGPSRWLLGSVAEGSSAPPTGCSCSRADTGGRLRRRAASAPARAALP